MAPNYLIIYIANDFIWKCLWWWFQKIAFWFIFVITLLWPCTEISSNGSWWLIQKPETVKLQCGENHLQLLPADWSIDFTSVPNCQFHRMADAHTFERCAVDFVVIPLCLLQLLTFRDVCNTICWIFWSLYMDWQKSQVLFAARFWTKLVFSTRLFAKFSWAVFFGYDGESF